MARTVLEVVVAGDSRSLEKAMGRSSKATDKFGKDADKGLKKASRGFSGVGKAAALAGGAIAGAGVAAGLKGIADAALESEKSTVKMRAQLKASGVSYKKYGDDIEKVIQKQSKLAALDDEDLQDAFTNIVRSTGSVSTAMKDMALVSDIARAKNIDVAKAGELLGKVHAGNTGVLRRYGIAFAPITEAQDKLKASGQKYTEMQMRAAKETDKVASAQDAMAQLQRRFAGQAEAYGKSNAGAADRFNVAVENLQEKLGEKLLPVMSSVASAGTKFINQMENGTGTGGKFAAIVGSVAGAVGGLLGTLKNAVKGFRDGDAAMVALGVTMGGLVAGFVAFKVITTVIAAMTALKAAVIGVNIAMRANPFVAVATVVAALGVALVVAYKKSETFRNVVDGVFRAVKKTVGDAISFVLRMFDKYLGGLSSIASAAAKLPIVGKKFKGVADQIDAGREKLRKMADGIDAIGEKKIKVRVDTSEVDDAIEAAGGLKNALKDSSVTLTPRPRGDGPGVSGSGLNAFNGIAPRFGVRPGSGLRPGARTVSGNMSYHAMGLARDFNGPPAALLRFFKYMKATYGPRLAELIYTPGGAGIKNGQPYRYSGKVAATHFDHVHVAMRSGASNHGDGYGVDRLKSLALGQGLSDANATTAAAVGMAESGGNPRASNRNSNGTIDRGLWQINSVHGSRSTFDVGGNARAMAAISRKGTNWKPWVAYTSGAYKKFLGAAKKAKPKGRRISKMGGQSIVPMSDYYQAIEDAKRERQGYQPTGVADGGDTGGGSGGAVDAPDVYGGGNASLALARLTDATDDDLAALRALEGVAAQGLAGAQAAGDNAGIAAFATDLKGFRDEIKSLTAAMEANTLEIERARADNERQLKEQSMQRERLSQSQYGVLATALSDVVSGNLGGRVGLGFQSVGFAGGGVRY